MSEEKRQNAIPQVNNPFGQWIIDFLHFKIMLIGEFTKLIFFFGAIGIIYKGIQTMRFNPVWGILFILFGVIGLHMFLELIMVLFSILDTLRSIRDRLPARKEDSEQK